MNFIESNNHVDRFLIESRGRILMIIFQDRQSINGNVNETSNELS